MSGASLALLSNSRIRSRSPHGHESPRPSKFFRREITFSKDELSFLNEGEPPEYIEIECPVCMLVMLNDPYQTSCGHHFCGSCIKRVQESNRPACPTCKTNRYETFPDKDRLRIINNLQVYCTNKESGCNWKGGLKDLIGHVNKGKRDGECEFEEVKCKYGCAANKYQRKLIDLHEHECPSKPQKCEYCDYTGTMIKVILHHSKCPKYPLFCKNNCKGQIFERESLSFHLKAECPLEPVECQFKGCREKPLRKDLSQHHKDNMKDHLALLAKSCSEMTKVIENLKKSNDELKEKNGMLQKWCGDIDNRLRYYVIENNN